MDWSRINALHDEMLAAVKAEDGRAWKESAGELHSQYGEMPFWILIYAGSDVAAVNRVFADIIRPYLPRIAPVKCTVGYSLLKDGEEYQAAFFNNNRQILDAAADGEIDDEPMPMGPPTGTFRATDSSR